MSDALSQLFALSWKGIEIPFSKLKMCIDHDLVEHKYWGVDGASIEDTGIAPIYVHATIPLQNGIVPGNSERWDVSLYPTVFRALLAAFVKREKGPLKHPEFGEMICKADKLDIDWDAMKRGGCDAEASWVQTLDEDARDAFSDKSPVKVALGAATTLDSMGGDIKSHFSGNGALDAFDALLAAADFIATNAADPLRGLKITTPFARLDHQARRLQDAVERAGDAIQAAPSPMHWRIVAETERIKSAVNDIRQQTNVVESREVGMIPVLVDTTLAGLLILLPDSTLGDLIRLNPGLMAIPIVSAGSLVRYYLNRKG